jgi:hypothetical protein
MSPTTSTPPLSPTKDALLDYVRGAFAAAERVVGAVDDQQWLEPAAMGSTGDMLSGGEPFLGEAVGDAILRYLIYANRHLGEIECMRAVQDLWNTKRP